MSTKIIHVSDTHLRPFNPEEGDILIHSGDALNRGDFYSELPRFREQLELIKDRYRYIIFTPGNHDRCIEANYSESVKFLKETVENIHVLHNESITIDNIKFYATADQPFFFNWAFNKSSTDLRESYSNIPEDTEVLITHCPAKMILDFVDNRFNPGGNNVGSQELADRLPKLTKLKAHLCGHIHFSNGIKTVGNVIHSNASICDEQYNPTNKWNVIEL